MDISDKVDVDEEGWTLVTRRRPRKQSQAQSPPLRHKKRQGRKKSPCHSRGKKQSKSVKRHEILPIDLLEQEPLVLVTLEEFFPTGFFEKVTVNMTSCSELEEEENEGSNRRGESLQVADKTLTVLEALPPRMGWGQIFYLPDEMCQHVVVALQYPELYADKIKDVGASTKGLVQCVSCNIAVTFTDVDLLLGSKPHNRPLFVTRYIRE